MGVVQDRLFVEEAEIFSCVAYFIWRQRNSMIHEGSGSNPIAVVQRAKDLLQGYKEAFLIDCVRDVTL